MGRYQLILKIPMYINKDVLQYVSRGGVQRVHMSILFLEKKPTQLYDNDNKKMDNNK